MWVFQKPIEMGIIKQQYFDDLTNRTAQEFEKIPEEKRTNEKKGLMIKTLESSIYSMDNETLRSFFAKLLASSADKEKGDKVSQYFPEVLSNLDTEDAELLFLFNNQGNKGLSLATLKAVPSIKSQSDNNIPAGVSVEIITNEIIVRNSDFIGSPDNKKAIQTVHYDKSLCLLEALGIIQIDSGISYAMDEELFSLYEKTELLERQNAIISASNFREQGLDEVSLVKGSAFLTPLGELFVDCVIP